MTTQLDTKTKTEVNANDDGVKFINIWIKGKTQLGRMLAHFYELPFQHPYFGPFNSMEGFWHYVQNIEHDDALRSLSGMAAKNYGKKLTWHYVKDFHDIIIAANFYKIEQNPELRKLFVESTLPFDYYYLYEPTGDAEGQKEIIIRPAGYKWLVDGFEEIRNMMHFGQRPDLIKYDEIFNIEK